MKPDSDPAAISGFDPILDFRIRFQIPKHDSQCQILFQSAGRNFTYICQLKACGGIRIAVFTINRSFEGPPPQNER